MKDKFGLSIKEIIIIIIVTALTTSITTGIIMYNNNVLENGAVNLNKDKELQEFLKVYANLNNDYYEDIDKSKMLDSAIEAMVDYLGEDYSTYLDKDETDSLEKELSGTYKGIGISVINNNRIYKVYPDTPASRVDLKEDDIIIKVNNEDVLEENIANMILKDGSENVLVVKRGDETHEVRVKAEEINSPLTREVIENYDKKVGYIEIPTFTYKVAEEFRKALEDVEQDGIDSLIIDLRSDTGGFLSGASEIASMFLEKDKTIYSLEEKNKKQTYKDNTDEKRDYKIVVLVNGSTASASEVLASALKESYGATLIGKATFGKGKVQQTKTLEDGSMVKYTTAKWYTPSDECIDEVGLFPDYSVDLKEDEEGNYIDTQLDKALEVLK